MLADPEAIGKADHAMSANPLNGRGGGRIEGLLAWSGGTMRTNAHPPEAWNAGRAQAVVARHSATEGGLLTALHDLQAVFGHIPDDAVRMLAHAFNLSRAEVHGVVSFYHDFRREPAGRHVVKLCQAEACQAMDARGLTAHACAALGLELGGTTPDGRITLEATYCLGLCATAPSAMVDGRLLGRVTPARLDAALGALA
jgi:formate dehydrogenase subunit gamma